MLDPLTTSLKEVFGFEGFRDGQEQTVRQIIQGQSSLAVFPTGAGKSLCYQLSALHLPHLTLVVSPLLALIKDQLDFLRSKGIAAASIDSTLAPGEGQQIMSDIRRGGIKILMISVERFKNERFRQFIDSIPISLLVVDEAHCISEWGHNFRPDYLKLPAYRKELNIPTVLLLTATATKKVKLDMAEKFSIDSKQIVQTGFYRSNLDLQILPVPDYEKKSSVLNLTQGLSGSGIIYVTLQHSAEDLASFLQENGIHAVAYHAGFKSEKRQQIQNDFMSGAIPLVVATIAFGMGIDKADIRFVIHYDLPKSIENFSQEIGRAGRDGLPSKCFTLANLDGLNVVENFVYGDTPEQEEIRFILDKIQHEKQHDQWELQLLSLSNESNIRQLPLKTLLVQLEIRGLLKARFSYFANYRYKLLQDPNTILNQFNAERQAFLNNIFQNSERKRIWATPDFEAIMLQTGSPRSRIVKALEYMQEKGMLYTESKSMTEVYQVNAENTSSELFAQELYQYFSSKETSEIQRIAELIRFFENPDCLNSRLALYFDDPNSPERCGHCSACRGQSAPLKYSQDLSWPEDAQLLSNLQGLKNHLLKKRTQPITTEIYCRFLTGLTLPVFTKNKVRQLTGFASCEKLPYHEVRQKVKALSPSLI